MMLMVTVPDGVASGQTIQISTPDGQMMMTTVPRGLSAGQQFEVSIAPATESMDRRGGDDELIGQDCRSICRRLEGREPASQNPVAAWIPHTGFTR
jgi:hypothetical protein